MARVTLILPARNEEATINRTLNGLYAVLGGKVKYLIIDDHSTDHTTAKVNHHQGAHLMRAVRNYRRPGLGSALKVGLSLATTEWVLFLTADGAENPQDILRMVYECERGDVDAVFGDRGHLLARVVGYSWWGWPLNRAGNFLISCAMESRYMDWTNLCKAYRREHLLQLDWSDDFRAVVEIPMRYLQRWPRMLPLPTDWTARTAGKSTFSWRRPLQQLEAWWRVAREH